MGKKYKLSEDEIQNIKGRRKFLDYVTDLINRDTGIYIYSQIYKRLGLKQDTATELSEDGEWLLEKVEIIKPNGPVKVRN